MLKPPTIWISSFEGGHIGIYQATLKVPQKIRGSDQLEEDSGHSESICGSPGWWFCHNLGRPRLRRRQLRSEKSAAECAANSGHKLCVYRAAGGWITGYLGKSNMGWWQLRSSRATSVFVKCRHKSARLDWLGWLSGTQHRQRDQEKKMRGTRIRGEKKIFPWPRFEELRRGMAGPRSMVLWVKDQAWLQSALGFIKWIMSYPGIWWIMMIYGFFEDWVPWPLRPLVNHRCHLYLGSISAFPAGTGSGMRSGNVYPGQLMRMDQSHFQTLPDSRYLATSFRCTSSDYFSKFESFESPSIFRRP